MSKLILSDNFETIIIKLSEGNPGAMNVLFELNPNDIMNWMPSVLTIDTMGLYGSHLYMLWNDSCNRDINKVKKIIEFYREGKITSKHIKERIIDVGYGYSFDDLLEEI